LNSGPIRAKQTRPRLKEKQKRNDGSVAPIEQHRFKSTNGTGKMKTEMQIGLIQIADGPGHLQQWTFLRIVRGSLVPWGGTRNSGKEGCGTIDNAKQENRE
jgi:hypothetical protein